RVEGLNQLHPAPDELDGPAEVGVRHVLEALLLEHVGELRLGDERGAGALADGHRVGGVIEVRMRHQHVSRVDVLGGQLRGRVVRPQEGVDEDAVVALHELNGRMAEVVDLHLRQSSFVCSGPCCCPSLSASAPPTATPTIIPMRASSASSVRTAVSRASSSGWVDALSTSESCDPPNQPPAPSASARIFCSLGAARTTCCSVSRKASGSESA